MLRNHYIIASMAAVLLAMSVWLAVPERYSAQVKVSDEYREVDLAVGLDHLEARVREVTGATNSGINNIDVYSQLLETDDFVRRVARTEVPGVGKSYGEYLGKSDTLDAVRDNIEFNVSDKTQTLTIQFSDREALVAAQMLDSVTALLQDFITTVRRNKADSLLTDARIKLVVAEKNWREAKQRYAEYADTHMDSESQQEQSELKHLQTDADQKYGYYEKISQKCTRQELLAQRPLCSFAIIKSNTVPQRSDTSLWPYLLSFLTLALLGVKGWHLYRQRQRDGWHIQAGGVFSPWSISMLVWLGMLFMFVLYGDNLYPPDSQFYTAIALWLPILVVTSFLTFQLLSSDDRTAPVSQGNINMPFYYLFFFLAVTFSPMFLYRVWQIVSMFDSKDMMTNVRVLAVYGEGQGILTLGSVFSQSILLVSLWAYPRVPKWHVILMALCCCICSVAIMEKGTFFMVFICTVYVLFERGVIRLRTISVLTLLLLGVFFLFNIMREGEDSDYAQNETLLDFLAMYVMSPVVAFCKIHPDLTQQFGTNTFEVIYDYLNRFGLGNFEAHSKLQEFVFVPVSTNVYTIMQPFFLDFGYAGVAFFAMVYGVATGAAYRYSKNGSMLFRCLYTYLVMVLVLQFYQENVFLSLSFCMQMLVILLLCTQDKIKITLDNNKAKKGYEHNR